MHTTPWWWATEMENVSATNLVQVGIGGWQVPRAGVQAARRKNTNIITIEDIEEMGLEKTAEIALELAWKDADMVYVSFDVDSVDCGFVPGTGWPEPGGFLPREALKLLGLVAAEGICGLEVVEVSPPYDTSDITSLLGTRVIVEALGLDGCTRHAGQAPPSYRQAGGVLIMHDHSHSHDHAHPHSHSHVHPHGHSHLHGHNAHGASQWQTPHLPEGEEAAPPSPEAQDMDLVERAFFDGFTSAPDPTSFLRLSGIPFEASDKEGARMVFAAGWSRTSPPTWAALPRLWAGRLSAITLCRPK